MCISMKLMARSLPSRIRNFVRDDRLRGMAGPAWIRPWCLAPTCARIVPRLVGVQTRRRCMDLPVFPSEKRTYTDRVSGVTVHQLTEHMAHSYHLYFTNPGWWDGDRRLLFGSERGNSSNLYSLELASSEITRLTSNPPRSEERRV